MKQFLVTGHQSLITLRKAFQSLRLLVDPAVEGSPFEAERTYPTYKSDKAGGIFKFGRRFGLR